MCTDLYEDFASYGFDVELYTPTPTRGVSDDVRKEYKKKRLEVKCDGMLKIHRFWMPKEGKNTVTRAFRYFLLNLILICKALPVKTDLIFLQSTPPTQGAVGAILKKIKKIPCIYYLQDIFPDSMVNMGLTKHGSLIYNLGRKMEDFTYQNMDKIITITNDCKQNILAKSVPESKIEIVSNWVDDKVIVPISKKDNILFDKIGLDRNKFYVVYAGNLGYAQNIEIILQTAKEMSDNPEIQFILFGNGTLENNHKQKAIELGLNNTLFFPLQPYTLVSHVYSLGDVSIVTCKEGFGGSAMPSKTWSIMSAGTPVIANFDAGGDMQRIIESNKIGIFSKAGDVEAFKTAIFTLFNNRQLCSEMGDNGRKFIVENLTRQICVTKIIKITEKVIRGHNYVS